MLLTSWIDSMRRTWRQRRNRRVVLRDRRQVAPRASIVEQLEDRTLLSAIVIESVGTGEAVSVDTAAVVGSGTVEEPEFSSIVIRDLEITPDSGEGIVIDLAGDSAGKLRLDSIVIQSAVVNGTGAAAIDLRLDDVVLSDVVIDDASINGESGSAVTIALHDSKVGDLTILNSQVSGQQGAGVSVNLDGSAVGSFNVVGTESDGVALIGVSGDHGVITNVTADAAGGPIQLETLAHGLSDGDVITVDGVVGDAASNGRHVVTVVDGNNVRLDTSKLSAGINDSVTTLTVDDISLLRPGTVVPFSIGLGSERLQVLNVVGNELTVERGFDGTTPAAHSIGDDVYATERSGVYLTGGDWAIPTRVEDVTVKESRLSGDTGADGFLLSLTDSQNFRVRINDNPLLEGVRVVVDNTQIPHLNVHNNLIQNHTVGSGVLVDATDSDVNGNITDNRILSNAHDGIELKLSDSNVGGLIAGNTVNGNQGNGINFDPNSSSGLHTIDFRIGGGHVGPVEHASNSEPIAVTSPGHGLRTGDLVYVQDVLGNVAANGTFHVNVLATELEQAVNLLQTTVVVDDVSEFLERESLDATTGQYDFQIRIGEEKMKVTGVDYSTNAMTVERAVAGTQVAGHSIDAPVYHDSMFELKGSSGVTSSTGVFVPGGGRISYASGGVANNVIEGNTGGAGIFANLRERTQLLGNVVANTVSNNSEGGLMVSSVGTNPVDHGGVGYSVVVGGSEAEGNTFDGNTGAGINFTLIDDAVGTFDVQHNTITRTSDDGDSSTNYAGDGVHVELIGSLVVTEAESSLNRAVIENNNIGADASTAISIAIDATQTAVPVTNSAEFESLATPFNVRIGREEMQVTNVGIAGLTVVRGVGTWPGEDHEAGDTVFTSNGGNDGRGVAVRVEEDSTVEDFYMANNNVVNNGDDGLKYLREDEGRANKVNPQAGQGRAITVLNNRFVNNGASSPLEEVEPNEFRRRGAGVDLHMGNGSIDLQDVEIVGNVIEANTGTNTSGVLVRAEADARLLVDIKDNRIRYNTADGIELSTRENDPTDRRQIGGTWVKNQITNNGAHGVQVIGRHGLYDNIPTPEVVVTPLFIGIEGVDPADGKEWGNVISHNGLDGMTVNRGGHISFANNEVKFNATGGIDIDPTGLNPNQTTSISGNDLSDNTGIGLDINAAPTVIATVRDNLIRNNDDPNLGDAVLTGDGIELSTEIFGQLHVVATGNFIEGNDGRGVDVRNTGTLQFKVGDPLLPMETGQNEIVGNRHEGVYIVNTADDAQPMDVDSSVDLTAAGNFVDVSPDLTLNFDTNVVEDNGIGSSLAGTGVVLRVGTSNGERNNWVGRNSTGDAFVNLSPPLTLGDGGMGEGIGTGVASNDGHWDKGNGRVNARVTDNLFDGNFGSDFWVEAYVSTLDPPTTGGVWDTNRFAPSGFVSDPLARVNLIFEGNTGNGMNPHAGDTPVYTNDEQNFKRRRNNKNPAGPFSSGTDPRSACLLPWRADPYLSIPDSFLDLPPYSNAIGEEFQFPGMGSEKTFRILTGFDTAGTLPSDQFETGNNFTDPLGPCGWDVVGTNLDGFVSVSTTVIPVLDTDEFVGGGGVGIPGEDGDELLEPGFTIQVGHEEMRVLTIDHVTDVLTVERGYRGTTAQPHLAGTPVGMFTFADPLTASFPLPDVVDVVPGLRNDDAGVISIVYTEDMQNIDIGDFALAFNDGTPQTSGVITGATHVRPDGTKTPVTITSVAHSLSNNDQVTISGILGNGAANGVYTVTNVTDNTFDLDVTAGGDYIGGGVWVKNIDIGLAGKDLTVKGVNEIQEISFSTNNMPTGGTFTLEFNGMVTDPISFDASASDVLNALTDEPVISTIGPGNVKVTGGPLPTVPIQVEFIGERMRLNQPPMVINGDQLTGIVSTAGAVTTLQHGNGTDYTIAFDTNETQRVSLNGASAGEFTLTFSGSVDSPTNPPVDTGLIPWNATATEVQTALEALASVGTGDVIVTGGPLPGFPVNIEFAGQYAKDDIHPLVSNDAPSLVGTSSVSTETEGRHVTEENGEYTLSILTDDVSPGATHDLLGNAVTQLVDGAGNTLNIGADDVWSRDDQRPAASFVAVTPMTRNSAVGVVTMNVDEDVVGVDIADFRLTRDTGGGPVNVPLDGLVVTELSPDQYSIDLNLKTSAAGDYQLSLVNTDPVTPIVDAYGNGIQVASVDWETNVVAPSASFAGVTTPRNTTAGVVTVNLSEPVTGVDIDDFVLTRDGQPVSMVGLTAGGGGATWTLDISSVTVAEGTYELSLLATDSGIVDDSGNNLPNDARVAWVMDTTAPTLDILDITPDPRTTDADIVNLIFSEPVDSSVVDINDLTLTLDMVIVPLVGVNLVAEGTGNYVQRYTADLRDVTDVDGNYVLKFGVPGGIADEAGNLLVVDPVTLDDPADSWLKESVDATPPTADILDIDPDPRTTGVDFGTVTFSEDVTGVDIGDFTLTRDLVAVDLSSAAVVEITPFRYAVDLSGVTDVDGDYALTLVASGSGISDAVGNLVQFDAADSWVKGNTGPNADIVDVAPDPRVTAVGDVTILFTDPANSGGPLDVTGLDIGDFELRRDGLLLDMTDVSLTPVSGNEYRLDLSSVTGVNGTYSLVLRAEGSGVEDGNNNPLIVDASDVWVTDTIIVVNSSEDLGDATPLGDGNIDVDLATPGKQITLRAAIQEANLLPGHDTISVPAGTYTLSLLGVGDDDSISGDLDVRQGLTIIGAGADETIIDADGLERVFQIFGGVAAEFQGLTITGGSVVGSEDGGGIRSAGDLKLVDVVVTGNAAEDSGGGINADGSLLMERVTVSDNTAGGDGGGVRNVGEMAVYNSTISGNSSSLDGGGLVNMSLGNVAAYNTTFSTNSAIRDGGGIHNEASISLVNVTVTANTVDNVGGGVSTTGVASVQNTLVAGNVALMEFPDVTGTFDSLGHNLIGNNLGAAASFPVSPAPGVANGNDDFVGDPANILDPLLDPNLGDNGGPTQTHVLLLGSDAIDNGDNAGFPSEIASEQRGAPRILDGPDLDLVPTIDIGAVEFGNFYVNSTEDLTDTTPLGDGLVDGDLLAIGKQITLRAALQEANALAGENTILLAGETYLLTMTEPDNTNPTADIVDVTPDPRDTPVGFVTVNFDEDVIGVDLADGAPDFVLTRDTGAGAVNVPLTGIGVTKIDNMTYTLDLSSVTDVNGMYSLTLSASGSSIVDLVGNPLVDDVVDEWLTGPDVYAPSADIVDVDPDPRSSAAGLVTIDFTEPVTGVDVADFTLTIDFGGGGGPSNVDLNGVTVAQVTPSQYTLDLAGTHTAMDGTYVLSLNATNAGIADLAGNALTGDATDQWVKGQDQVAPTADIVDVFPDPRITNVGLVTVDFSEPVTGVTVDDFSLTRDSGSGAINIPLVAVTVTQLASDQYTINLNTVTGFDGVYVLTLNANATIQDLPGNAMLVDATDTWQRGEASDGSGDLDITDTTGGLTIIGVGSDGGTTIDANGIDRTFQVLDGVSATLRDLALTGGVVTGSSEGGAIHNSGSLLAQGVRLFGNLSDAAGGAVFNTSAGDVTLDASTVTQNQAFDGGGVYNSDNAVVTIRNSEINLNVSGNDGGGVYNDLDGMVMVSNSDVVGNAAVGQGGGVYNNDAADLTVSNSRFSVNTSEDGAGIFNELAGDVVLNTTTFTANVASGDGGAIYNDDGNVGSERGIYSSNSAMESGGAIYNTSNGDVTLVGDTLTLNSAPQRGGAIDNYGLLTIDAGSLTHNVSDDGGAIATARGLDLTDSVVSYNDAVVDGGGIFNDEVGVVSITGSDFVGNTAGVDGGALSNVDSGVTTLEFSSLGGNQAGSDGGAVHNTSAAGLNVSASLLYDNEAVGRGGGVANDSIGVATVVNTTFSGNQATTGGGVFNQGEFELVHSTVYKNAATDGGGVANDSTVPDVIAMRNTIVAKNSSSTANRDDVFGTGYQSDGHNLIGNVGTDPNLIASFGVTDLVGTPGSTIDPSLYDLQFNGGPTYSHGLLFGSPARDAGDNTGAPATDQRGFARLFDGDGDGVTTVDIGAVESGFIVNSYLDSVDVNPNDGISADNDGLSSLRAAINEANARPGRDTIILPSGTFLLTLTGRDDDTGLVGDLDINDDLEILGADDGLTVIDADGIDRVFHVAAGASLSVSNVTITGGNAGTAAYGGAVLNSGGLVFNEVVVTGNVAARGGGVFNAGDLTVADSTIESNRAYVQGGGVFNFQSSRLDGSIGDDTDTLRVVDADAFPLSGTFVIRVDSEDMLVTDVSGDVFTVSREANDTTAAEHFDGATIKLQSGGNVTISNSTISDNTSDAQGGGLYNQDSVEIFRSEVVGNTANSRGGAVYNASVTDSLDGAVTIGATTVKLSDASAFPIDTPFDVSVGAEIMAVTSVSGNDFTVVRGAGGTLAAPHGDTSTVVLQGFSSVLVLESTLANNSAIAAGGAVFNEDVLNVVNSTISTNSAGAGGGIASIGRASLSAVTVVNNSAGNAGGIASDGGSATTKNTLIAANNASGADVDVRGVFVSAGNNLVGDVGSASGLIHGENDDQVGSPTSPFDPVIDLTLRDNGGPTRTHRLLPSSPAIGTGDNTGGGDTTDQRGSKRPANDDSDIGAFELAFLNLVTSDVSLVEGSTGAQVVDVPVILSATSVEEVTVAYTTVDGTAFQGSDYQSASGVVTFQPGEITQNITVLVNGDLSVEPTETFFVELSSATGADLFGSQAVVTILNDDTAVAIDDATVIEGDSGQVQLDYTVRLVQPIDTPVQITVEVETNDGTAVSTGDYTAVSPTTLVFGDPTDPAQLSQTVSVLVDGDVVPEPDEIVYLDVVSTTVNISDGRGDGVIQNDDAELTVGVQPNIDEGANLLGPQAVDFPVSLTYASAVPVTVDFATSNGDEIQDLVVTGTPTSGQFYFQLDGAQSGPLDWPDVTAAHVQAALETISALAGNVTVVGDLNSGTATVTFGGTLGGTNVSELVPVQGSLNGGSSIEVTTVSEAASSGDDYDAASGTLTFAPGVTSQLATVTVNDDVVLESDETFFVTLDPNSVTKNGAADTNATVGGPGVGTIIDNELPPDEYRLYIDGTDYRVDWTAPDGTTEIYYLGDGVSPPISVLGDRGNLTSASPAPGTDDLLVIDFIGGNNPIPASGLVFLGGANASADVIELRPDPLAPIGAFSSADYLVTGIGNGIMSLDAFQVDYTDVEAVFDAAEVTSRSFAIDPAYAGNQEMRTRDAAGVGNSLFEGTGTTPFGMFSFQNPDATVGSLVIDAGPGDNTVTLDPMDSTLSATIQVDGGDGHDTILAAATFAADLHILGGAGDDSLRGGAGNDLVEGGAGNDSPSGGGGADTLDGGVGDDVLAETADADFNLTDTELSVSGEPVDTLLSIELASLTGGDSNNAFDATGFSGSVTLNGEAGDDLFFGSAGNDVFNGGVGSDRVEQTTGQGQRLNNSQVEMGAWTFDAISVPPTWTFTATSSDNYTEVEQFVLYGDLTDNVINASGYDQGDVTIDGAAGNDRLTAGKLNDSVIGGLGNDWINAKSGNDYLEGGDGDDTLLAGYGDDTATSGDGNDFINANAGNDYVDAGNDNDRVRGAEGDDTIFGGAGDDQLDEILAEGNVILTDTSMEGDLGNDVLDGIESAILNGKVGSSSGQGDNYFGASEATIPVTMYGGSGRDTMIGGHSADYLNGNGDSDRLEGGPGNDFIQGGAGKDFLVGGLGDDTIQGQGSNDTLKGENGNDVLHGGAGYDRVFEWADQSFTIVDNQLTGGLGTDVLTDFEEVKLTGGAGANNLDASGFSGKAVLWGAAGDDTLVGGVSSDRLNGGPGHDSVVGNGGSDTLFGGSGNDTMEGNGGADVVYGQRDHDSIKGGAGDDYVLGDDGNDTLNGGEGNDTLRGGAGADGISGWTGDDVLNGNSGRDTIVGGEGMDRMFGGNDRDVMLGEDDDDYIKGQTGDDVLSGGAGNDKGIDYAVPELGNWSGEIDEEFTFYDSWIDNI